MGAARVTPQRRQVQGRVGARRALTEVERAFCVTGAYWKSSGEFSVAPDRTITRER